jgi:dienelactone hydrolase
MKRIFALLIIMLSVHFVLTSGICKHSYISVDYAAADTAPEQNTIKSELVEIDTRPGTTQKLVLLTADNAVASAILLVDGPGKIDIGGSKDGPTIDKKNFFLVRIHEDLAMQGINVAVLDVASDQQKEGLSFMWRLSDLHANDINAVADYLKKTKNVPVWIVGSSNGSLSAASIATRNPEKYGGIVFASSLIKFGPKVKVYKTHPKGILSCDLSKITLPVLILAHRDDQCPFTAPSGSEEVKAALVNSPVAKVIFYSGGKQPEAEACRSLSAHGFYGLEKEVANDIARFIKGEY